MRACCARAPRRTSRTCYMRHERALHEREAALLRCKAVLRHGSPGPHLVRWLARVARLHATALALCWEEAQHARLLRTRAAPRWSDSLHAPRKGTARARSRPPSVQGRAPCASLGPHLVRWLARVARLQATALALSGEEAQHVPFRPAHVPGRARRTRFMRCGRALHKREAAFLRCKAVLPCASLVPHLVRWLARVARLHATALALCWEEAQHARLLCVRAAPRWSDLLHAL